VLTAATGGGGEFTSCTILLIPCSVILRYVELLLRLTDVVDVLTGFCLRYVQIVPSGAHSYCEYRK
jgi:hypothetical protein